MGLSSPSGGAANSVGNQQTSAVTGQNVTPADQTAITSTYNSNPVHPEYWENQGYQLTQDFGTGQQSTFAGYNIGNGVASSGGKVYTNPTTGEVVFVDANGNVTQRYTKEQWAAEQAKNQNGVTSAGEINQGAKDIMNGVPTPLISDSTKQSINNDIVDTATGMGPNQVTVGPTGVSVGGNPVGPQLGGGTPGAGSLTGTPEYQNLVDFANQLQGTRNAYGGGTTAGTAPVMSPVSAGPAAQIDPSGLAAAAQQITAPVIGAPGAVIAPALGRPVTATAQQIAAPGAVAAPTVGAQQIGPVGLSPAAGANVTAQQAAQNMIAGAAAGNAPSAAEQLLRKGMDESAGTALGMAATLQGSRPGLALRAGQQGARAAMAKSAADMAALRAQEQATARGQYAEATQASRAQDIQAASTNLQAQIDTLKANQATALTAGNTNAANALQAQIATLQTQLEASKANQSAALQTSLANQSTTTDIQKTQAAMQMQAQVQNLQAQIDTAKQNAANALAAGQSNQAAALQAQIATMTAQLNAMTTNANLSQNQGQFDAAQAMAAQEKNQQAALMQQQLNNNQYLGLTQLQQQAYLAPYQAQVQQQQIAQQQAAANQAFYAQLIGAGATALAASDETLKTNIEDGAAAATMFLDAIEPKTFEYRDGRKYYPGRQLGVIAQDLPASVVTRGPDGKKWISANVIGQILAGLGTVHKRVAAIEEHRGTAQLTQRATGDTVPPSGLADFARKLAS